MLSDIVGALLVWRLGPEVVLAAAAWAGLVLLARRMER